MTAPKAPLKAPLYLITQQFQVIQQSQVNQHLLPIQHMNRPKVPQRSQRMHQLMNQRRSRSLPKRGNLKPLPRPRVRSPVRAVRLRVVKEVRPCSTNQTRMVGGMLLARMVGTSLTRQNGMIRVGNAWTVSSFDSDGTFGTHL